MWLQINFFKLNLFVDVLLVYIERRRDEKAYSADGNGADKPGSEKGGNLVSKFTDLHHHHCLWSGGGAAWVEIIMACR